MTGMSVRLPVPLGAPKSHVDLSPASSWSSGTGGVAEHLACSTLVPENSTNLLSRSVDQQQQQSTGQR